MKIVNTVLVACLLYTPFVSAEDWITEEVLKQLSEVRQELKVLQDEVRGLKDQLAQNPVAQQAPQNEPLNIAGAPFIGKDEARFAIVEFSDYQCPYCKRHYTQTFPQIAHNYIESGKVRYVMKQFPLGFHAKARGASIAALCVEKSKRGGYWKAHEAMFSGETKLARDDYLVLANSLSIKKNKFESCLDDPEMGQLVDSDMQLGTSVGVQGTPAFYIGKLVDGKVVDGQLLTGARPFSSFSSVIDKLLSEG